MTSIDRIINYLDDYLVKNKMQSVDPLEANALLEKAGILNDSKDRRGKPLRDLLRKGFFPHAYQPSGKGSHWVIPHSNDNSKGSNYQNQKSQNQSLKKTIKQDKITSVEIVELKKQLANARTKYKPTQIKYLLVAQAPPDSLDRFFYYENVYTRDYLFIGVINVLYPEFLNHFLENRKQRKSSDIKKLLLEKFKEDGFYLLDLSELPLTKMEGKLKSQVPILIENLRTIINAPTKIILIKADVYRTAFNSFVQAGFAEVIDCKIPFPNQGWQTKFQLQFKHALKLASYK